DGVQGGQERCSHLGSQFVRVADNDPKQKRSNQPAADSQAMVHRPSRAFAQLALNHRPDIQSAERPVPQTFNSVKQYEVSYRGKLANAVALFVCEARD